MSEAVKLPEDVPDLPPVVASSQWATTAVCSLIFVALCDAQLVAAIAPSIAANLGATETSVAGSTGVYAIAAASVALLLSRFAGRVRTRLWLPLSAVIFVAAATLAAVSSHIYVFYLARALAGFAGGLISALAIAALADASAYAGRGKQMSGIAVSYFLAPIIGIPIGAYLTEQFGWRMTFGVVAGCTALVGIIVWRLPMPIRIEDENVHHVGAQSGSVPSVEVIGFAGLMRMASRSHSTLMGLTGAFFVSGGVVGFTSFAGVWLFQAFRVDTGNVGLVYALAGAAAIGGGLLGGYLADCYGKRRIALRGSVALSVLLLIVPTFTLSITLVVLIALAAFVAALRIAPLQALITELVAPHERATYIALRNACSQLGIAATVWLCASIYPRFGMAGVGASCAVLTGVAWLCIRLIREPHGEARAVGKRAAGISTLDEASVNKTTLGEIKPDKQKTSRIYPVINFVIALVLIFCVGVPYLVSFAITKAGTRPDERNRSETPADLGAEFENVTFASADGNTLSGWYLPSRNERTTIIMTHGLFRSRYELLARGIEFWRRGYGVLLYDLRRHGASPAEFSTLGFAERRDVIAAAKFARGREPANRIVLMGVSMGAAATLMAAAELNEDESITAVVVESSFLSFDHTITHHLRLAHIPTIPFAALLTNLTAWRMNFAAGDFDLRRATEKVTVPILFIGGSLDVRMPTESVLEPLYEAARHPAKRKLVITDAKHGQAFIVAPEEYVNTIQDFLREVGLLESQASWKSDHSFQSSP